MMMTFLKVLSTAAIATVLVGGLAGCSTRSSTRAIGGPMPDGALAMVTPISGRELNENFWEKASNLDGDFPVVREEYVHSMYSHVRKDYFELGGDRESADSRTYRMTYIGMPEFYLPLYMKSARHHYEAGSLDVTEGNRRIYTPFYSYSTSAPEGQSEPVFKAGGIPLLYEGGVTYGKSWHFEDREKRLSANERNRFWNVLWWVGPAYFSRTMEFPDSQTVSKRQIKGFTPLFLGKTPGILLWSHFTFSDEYVDGSRRRWRGHGPLGGLMLWIESENESPEDGFESRRGVLGGLLWSDVVKKREAEGVYESTRGFLWTGLGYAKRVNEEETKKQLRLFWIPITYSKKAND